MRDKRPVDELSIEELERILALRKREERLKRLRRLNEEGRRVRPAASANGEDAAPIPLRAAAPTVVPEAQPAPVTPELPNIGNGAVAQEGERIADAAPRFEDDLAEEQAGTPQPQAQSEFWTMVWNRALLVIEIAAFIGLVFIGVEMVRALQTLNSETAAVQAQAQAQAFASLPTPSPTPEIRLNRLVLPSGHTPPTSPGGAQFNFNEIPEQFRPIIQQQLAAPIIIPTPGPENPVRLQIPRLNVDSSVVIGTEWEALRRGVGYLPGSGVPGRTGNVVLSAHNDIYGEIFRYLDQLEPGDAVIIHTVSQRYTYTVRETSIVSPYTVDVMNPTTSPTATLISCYPYQVDNQRIVVFADLSEN